MPRLEEKVARAKEQAADQLPDHALEVSGAHTEELVQEGLAERAVGVGDRAGVVRWASVSPDYTDRPDPADTVEALRGVVGG